MPLEFTLDTLAATLETQIRGRRLLELPVPWQSEIIFPHYHGLSIYNLAQSILAIFGASVEAPLLPAAWLNPRDAASHTIDRVVIFISDGLGYRLLRELVQADADLRQVVSDLTDGRGFVPLTSVAPSTTACALPTLWTGQPPAATGMVGTTLFLREVSAMADMLNFAPAASTSRGLLEAWGIDPATFVPVPTLPERLLAMAVPTHLVLDRRLAGSGLSRLMHRGVQQLHRHTGGSDALLRLEDALIATQGQRCLIHAYLPNVDSLAHLYGQNSRYLQAEITHQLTTLRRIVNDPAIRDGHTLLLISADHGHSNIPQRIDFAAESPLKPVQAAMRGVFGGDARFANLYLRAGTREAVLDILAEYYADRIAAVAMDQAVKGGLFGDGRQHPDLHIRLGDVLLLPRTGYALQIGEDSFPMLSTHAGLSDREMLVPLLWKQV